MTARESPETDTITTIPLRKSTRDRLRQLGAKGETYDALLRRLMDAHELARAIAEEGRERLRNERRLLVEFERVEAEAGAPLPEARTLPGPDDARSAAADEAAAAVEAKGGDGDAETAAAGPDEPAPAPTPATDQAPRQGKRKR